MTQDVTFGNIIQVLLTNALFCIIKGVFEFDCLMRKRAIVFSISMGLHRGICVSVSLFFSVLPLVFGVVLDASLFILCTCVSVCVFVCVCVCVTPAARS